MCNCKSWIPRGSQMEMVDGEMVFHAPEPWNYVGYIGGELVSGGGTTNISCTCNVEGQCSPFYASGPKGTTSGCAGGCTDCTMKKSLAGGGDPFTSGGYYNLDETPRIMDRGEELPPGVFRAMWMYPKYNKELSPL